MVSEPKVFTMCILYSVTGSKCLICRVSERFFRFFFGLLVKDHKFRSIFTSQKKKKKKRRNGKGKKKKKKSYLHAKQKSRGARRTQNDRIKMNCDVKRSVGSLVTHVRAPGISQDSTQKES